jgi:hypothetical protein
MLTKASVDRLFPAFWKPKSTSHFRLISPCHSDLPKVVVVRVGGVPPPANNLAFQDHQPAEFDPGNPAMVAGASLADLSLTMPLTDGVN